MKQIAILKKVQITSCACLQKSGSGLSLTLLPLDKKDRACQKAFLAGKESGLEEGYRRAKIENKSFITLLQSIARRLLEQKEQIFSQLKPELINLAMIICEKIIRKELSSPMTLVKLIDSELSSMSIHLQEESVSIVLSPDDLILLEKHLSKIFYDKREIKKLHFVSDPHLLRGDFRIETAKSLLNCSIQRELEDLQQKILKG